MKIIDREMTKDELLAERSRLTEENNFLKEELRNATAEVFMLRERNADLHASCTELAQKCASLNDENERLKAEKEAKNKELFYKWKKIADETADRYEGLYQDAKKSLVADTVRKMQERLKAKMSFGRYIQADQIDKIAEEMLNDGN